MGASLTGLPRGESIRPLAHVPVAMFDADGALSAPSRPVLPSPTTLLGIAVFGVTD